MAMLHCEYIYIYMSLCVCVYVCVCVSNLTESFFLQLLQKILTTFVSTEQP